MVEKNDSFTEIARQELKHVEDAYLKYKDLLDHCAKVADFFFRSIESVKNEALLVYPFIGQVYSHSLLAVLSASRLHYTQSMLNLRVTLEATTWCLFVLGHPNDLDAHFNSNGPDERLKNKMYKWLDKNYPKSSKSLKERKDLISEKITIHSNLMNASRHTQMTDQTVVTSFFDMPRKNEVEASLWLISNTLLNCTESLYRVNKDHPIIMYSRNFDTVLSVLRKENDKLQISVLEGING